MTQAYILTYTHTDRHENTYPSAEMLIVYSAAPSPADWATGHSLGESYPSAEMQSEYYAAPLPTDWADYSE